MLNKAVRSRLAFLQRIPAVRLRASSVGASHPETLAADATPPLTETHRADQPAQFPTRHETRKQSSVH